jgi:dinuclear metal center YbgI/SA1388 family protein
MIYRKELEAFLDSIYDYDNFDDHCENGLQVEGKEKINKIAFGVSFNLPFLERAVEEKVDAVIVHHGIFQEGVFKLKGILKQKVKILLEKNISLFGIHLPMDANASVGHSALLLKAIEAEKLKPFDVGYIGENAMEHSLERILEVFHKILHGNEPVISPQEYKDTTFSLSIKHGFTILENGPTVPRKLAVITGDSSGFYEKAVELGVDTFFGGNIKEKIPAFSLETSTNFVNLGHYNSEKPGVLTLKSIFDRSFDIETVFIEIPNPV